MTYPPAASYCCRTATRNFSETGLEEINGAVPETDFWPASTEVRTGYNFIVARNPGAEVLFAWSRTST
jgi:hypothetical protein